MAFEKKNNAGALWKNERKASDNHPDLTGNAVIDGKEVYVSAWMKTDRNNKRFYSLSFRAKADDNDLPIL